MRYEMPDGSWDMEREQADYDMASLRASGIDASRNYRRAIARILKGDLEGAASVCPHGWCRGSLCFHCGADIKSERPAALSHGPAMCAKCDESLVISGRGAICGGGHDWSLKSDARDAVTR